MKKSLLHAALVSAHEISVVYLPNYSSIDEVDFYLVYENRKIRLHKEINTRQSIPEIKLISAEPIRLGREYFIESSVDGGMVPIDLEDYVQSDEFDELYYYPENDLGPTYSPTKTSFKFWSPISSQVFLKVERNNNKFLLYKKFKSVAEIFPNVRKFYVSII